HHHKQHSFPTRRSSDLYSERGVTLVDTERLLSDFNAFLKIEKNASLYTVKFYLNDIQAFFDFLNRESVTEISQIDQHVVRLFLRSEEHTSELQSRFDLV